MYFSDASRTTQANDTFFCFASSSRVSYTSGGNVIVARTDDAPLSGFMLLAAPFFRFILYRTITAFHHIGDAKTSPTPGLILSGSSAPAETGLFPEAP
jgi:hypothetical protein